MSQESAIPVYKIGAVIVRDADSAAPKFLLVRPKGKKDGKAPWVLPRGSREVYNPLSDTFFDIRNDEDAADVVRLGLTPEPEIETIIRELEEEAGITGLDPNRLTEIGVKIYRKSEAEQLAIYWFGLIMTDEEIAAIHPEPEDAAEPAQWFSVAEMEALAAEGKARQDYIRICKEVLEELLEPSGER